MSTNFIITIFYKTINHLKGGKNNNWAKVDNNRKRHHIYDCHHLKKYDTYAFVKLYSYSLIVNFFTIGIYCWNRFQNSFIGLR